MLMPQRALSSFLLTGHSGVGKTTAVLRILEVLKALGVTTGGMITEEAREDGKRLGFRIKDISSKEEGWLASKRREEGPRIGSYRVNKEDLDEIGSQAVLRASKSDEVVVCDEIGPMEMTSEEFQGAVRRALEADKVFLATLHSKYVDPLPDFFECEGKKELFRITMANRDAVPLLVTDRILTLLREEGDVPTHWKLSKASGGELKVRGRG